MILIDAVYIWQAGGKNLLDLLIDQVETETTPSNLIFLIDMRIKMFYVNRKFNKIKIKFIEGSELARYKYYVENRHAIQKVLCFANIPPPVRLNCVAEVYFQNILFFDKNLVKYFSVKQRLMFTLKRYFIRMRLKNSDNWIVQTDHVRDLLLRETRIKIEKIKVIPFFNDEAPTESNELTKKENAFFYPAMGAAHKNHERLLQAWRNLYCEGKLKHDLHLTIDQRTSKGLFSEITKLKKEGIPIYNHGYLSKSDIDTLYAKCKFVIHPSLGESFGLVLIEAIRNNCILLAPDLPYVNSIVHPNYYFDAHQINTIEKSIMRAISEEGLSASKILVNNEILKLVKSILN